MSAYVVATRPTAPISAASPDDAARFVYGDAARAVLSPLGSWVILLAGIYVDDLQLY